MKAKLSYPLAFMSNVEQNASTPNAGCLALIVMADAE